MKKRVNKKRGNTFIEFALATTLIVPVFTGCFQYGYTFYVYNELVSAVRDGVRYAAVSALADSGNGVTPTAFSNTVKNVVVYGNTAGTGNPIVPNLSTTNVNVTVTYDTGNVPTDVMVAISGYTVNGIFSSFTFNKPILRMAYTGRYCSTAGGASC